jgi:hypothetical protein
MCSSSQIQAHRIFHELHIYVRRVPNALQWTGLVDSLAAPLVELPTHPPLMHVSMLHIDVEATRARVSLILLIHIYIHIYTITTYCIYTSSGARRVNLKLEGAIFRS